MNVLRDFGDLYISPADLRRADAIIVTPEKKELFFENGMVTLDDGQEKSVRDVLLRISGSEGGRVKLRIGGKIVMSGFTSPWHEAEMIKPFPHEPRLKYWFELHEIVIYQ